MRQTIIGEDSAAFGILVADTLNPHSAFLCVHNPRKWKYALIRKSICFGNFEPRPNSFDKLSLQKMPYCGILHLCLSSTISLRQHSFFTEHLFNFRFLLISLLLGDLFCLSENSFLEFDILCPLSQCFSSWFCLLVLHTKLSLNSCVSISFCSPKYALGFLWVWKSLENNFLGVLMLSLRSFIF